MRKHVKGMSTGSLRQTRRVQVIGVVALVIIFAMVATALSLQTSKAETAKSEQSAGNSSLGNSLPLRTGSQGQTFSQAQIRPLTQAEAQQLAEGIKNLVNQSTDGLKQVRHADGSVSMDLQGRFQNVALAKKTDEGHVVQSCVDNPEAAADFLGIDRQLIDGKKSSSSKTRQPATQPESGMPGKGQD